MRKTLTGVALAMCSTLAGTAAQAADFTLRPIGHQTIATGTLYQGVEFGGISGIDRLATATSSPVGRPGWRARRSAFEGGLWLGKMARTGTVVGSPLSIAEAIHPHVMPGAHIGSSCPLPPVRKAPQRA